MRKTYTIEQDHNGLRGAESVTLLLVRDQNGIVWDDRQISRDLGESVSDYHKRIATEKAELCVEWDISQK